MTSAEIIGVLVNAAIPICAGLYGTLLAHRLVGKQARQDARYDQWHNKYAKYLKILGPFLIIFGIFTALQGLS